MTKLVIAEKPMLARDIARAICGRSVSETERPPISGNGYTVVSCAGHLLSLKEPHELDPQWKKWDLADLPIAPKTWEKKITPGKEKYVELIKEQLEKCESVIHAGDPDDEGQLIVDEVLEYLHYAGKVERVYVNDNIEQNIKAAFESLIDNKLCKNISAAAESRALADFCFGINESRLASCRLHQKLHIGRVKTPTLGLIVKRDKEIKNHVGQKYYAVYAQALVDGRTKVEFEYTQNTQERIAEKEQAGAIARMLQGQTYGFETVLSDKYTQPPLPYNLTTLMADMSKEHKLGAQQTQNATQTLRDAHHAITYNRTDCQYLKTKHFEQAPTVTKVVQENLKVEFSLDLQHKTRAFNDEYVDAHHAIIPQEIRLDLSALTEIERKVYQAIAKRYLMQFMPAKHEIEHKSVIELEGGSIKRIEKRLVEPGYSVIEDTAKQEEERACLEEGKHTAYIQEVRVEERTTKPPKPYTEGTLISDMSRISRYVEDKRISELLKKKDEGKKGEHGGIGTTATRAAIIEELKRQNYIEERGGKLRSTELGQRFYEMIPPEIAKADTTATWWLIQQEVEAGRVDKTAVMEAVIKVFNAHKGSAYLGVVLPGSEKKVLGVCPICGKDVYLNRRGTGCYCSGAVLEKDEAGNLKNSGCQFSVTSWCKKQFSESQLRRLLEGKKVHSKGFISKKGTRFEGDVQLTQDGKIKLCV